jgi:c-di-GMP-binding flagellar brake protein YcgR
VQCVAGRGVLYGHCVNLSRSGMQLVVNRGVSHDSIRSIAFSLPNSSQTLQLPCRLVREHSGDGQFGERVLGIEFSPNADAQLLLIDRYVQEVYAGQAAHGRELRQLPRADCAIGGVEIDHAGVRVTAIENISAEGLLLSFTGVLSAENLVALSFRLPGDERLLRVSGRVTYVIRGVYGEVSSAGVELTALRELDRCRIANYVASAAARGSLRGVHRCISRGGLDPRYRIDQAGRSLRAGRGSQPAVRPQRPAGRAPGRAPGPGGRAPAPAR